MAGHKATPDDVRDDVWAHLARRDLQREERRLESRRRAAAIRKTLSEVQPGASFCFQVPGEQPFKRIQYQQINQVCHALYGAGGYRISVRGREVLVVRKLATR